MTEVHVAVGSYVVDGLQLAERAEFETTPAAAKAASTRWPSTPRSWLSWPS